MKGGREDEVTVFHNYIYDHTIHIHACTSYTLTQPQQPDVPEPELPFSRRGCYHVLAVLQLQQGIFSGFGDLG